MNETTAITALAALAQETRLRTFRRLVEAGPKGLAAGRLASALKTPPATLSFHLAQLAHARLISARREGRSIVYSADFAAVRRLVDFLTENCCARGGARCDVASPTSPTGRTAPLRRGGKDRKREEGRKTDVARPSRRIGR